MTGSAPIRRRPDGSIDYGHYGALAREERAAAMRAWLRGAGKRARDALAQWRASSRFRAAAAGR